MSEQHKPLLQPLDHCLRCGYSLVGLPEPCTCPECGLGWGQRASVYYYTPNQYLYRNYLLACNGGVLLANILNFLSSKKIIFPVPTYGGLGMIFGFPLLALGMMFAYRSVRPHSCAITLDDQRIRLWHRNRMQEEVDLTGCKQAMWNEIKKSIAFKRPDDTVVILPEQFIASKRQNLALIEEFNRRHGA